MESFCRDLSNCMTEHRPISCKNNQNTHYSLIFPDRPMFSHINGKFLPIPLKWGTSAKKKNRSCLKTNWAVTSRACPGVISRLWPDQPPMVVLLIVTVWGEKQEQKTRTTLPRPKSTHCTADELSYSRIFLGSAESTMDEVLHRGRLGSSRFSLFWGNFFFSFWRKSLIIWLNIGSSGKLTQFVLPPLYFHIQNRSKFP